jgi:hypothetical protein
MGICSFQTRNETFFYKVKKIKGLRGDVQEGYVAQGIPLIDAEIAKKGHFWMETSLGRLEDVLRSLVHPTRSLRGPI